MQRCSVPIVEDLMGIALVPRPSHVPEELVQDFDFFHFADSESDNYLAWKQVQSSSPRLFWTPRNGGHWVATRAEDIKLIFEDYERFSSRHESIPTTHDFRFPPVEYDPPSHLEYRKLIVPFFTPNRMGRLRQLARDLTVELIEGFKDRGECEFYGEFGLQMPIGIFLHLVDLPSRDREVMLPWAEQSVRGSDPAEMSAAQQAMWAYLEERFEERRKRAGDDLITVVAHGHVEGRPLDREEMIGMGTVILSAGLDTVASTLSFVMRFLAENPDQRNYIVENPGMIPKIIDEFLRRFPVASLARCVARDQIYEGVELKEGEMILVPSALYNFDDSVFEDPMAMRYDRPQSSHNLTFGWGSHRCVGMALARTELQVFLEEWLGRIPDFEIRPGARIRATTGRVSAITHLPIVWDPGSTRSTALVG